MLYFRGFYEVFYRDSFLFKRVLRTEIVFLNLLQYLWECSGEFFLQKKDNTI
jgi:hypothetical protein